MAKDALCFVVSHVSFAVCAICPLTIGWLAERVGNGPLPDDHPDRIWAREAVDHLFLIALGATVLFIVSARRWWWLAALMALPLLVVTAMLAVTGGMWIDGTYL